MDTCQIAHLLIPNSKKNYIEVSKIKNKIITN